MSFKVLAWAQSQKTGSPATKAVLLALAAIVNDEGEGFPSQDRIATDTELSIRTVRRAMAFLEGQGIITRERRYREGGYRTSDVTKIHTERQILPDTMSPDRESPDTVSNLTGHSGRAEPVIEPVNKDCVSAGASVSRETMLPDAVVAWNLMAKETGLAQVQRMTDGRRKSLRARMAECGGDVGWQAALAKVKASKFLTGNNANGWKADFDFLLQAKSFTKLMEGAYDNRPSNFASRPKSHGDAMRDAIADNFRDAQERERQAGYGHPHGAGNGGEPNRGEGDSGGRESPIVDLHTN